MGFGLVSDQTDQRVRLSFCTNTKALISVLLLVKATKPPHFTRRPAVVI